MNLRIFLLVLLATIAPLWCLALTITIKSSQVLGNNITHSVYNASEIPLVAHVIKLPLDTIDIQLVPALGQREEVSSIAKRSHALIAINGSNYRRGGKYNGHRVNLFYRNKQIVTDLNLIRGSFGWNSTTKSTLFNKVFLKTTLHINGITFPIDQINQPRAAGQSVLYTELADISLLAHTPGTNIVINSQGIIVGISQKLPDAIQSNWYIYQVDQNNIPTIQNGMTAIFSFKLESLEHTINREQYDFIIAGAGLLILNGNVVINQLYDEFSQGNAIVHTNDEVAADFHTKEMQQWLIELRHPRTAIGITRTNEFCIVVVDGRQRESEGLSLHELAFFMQQLGCIQALNIGGGGCSTLCIQGRVVNSPSALAERPVSEALCFYL